MKESIILALEHSRDLPDVRQGLLALLGKIKTENPTAQIWFITGVITAEGPEFRSRNRELLTKYGEHIRNTRFPFAFSAVDVFSEELIKRVKANGAQGKDFTPMWIEFINETKDLLTGVITTPRWQNSPGSLLEVETALNLGLSILRMEEELLLLQY
jgi:hypothetical protein